MSETRWVCDDCGAVSDDENASCSCDDDVSDLIAEIKTLRERQRTITITSSPHRVVALPISDELPQSFG
jgi:hypothetical protein